VHFKSFANDATMRAYWAIGPELGFQEFDCGFFGAEVLR
jgi:hypothetical protein